MSLISNWSKHNLNEWIQSRALLVLHRSYEYGELLLLEEFIGLCVDLIPQWSTNCHRRQHEIGNCSLQAHPIQVSRKVVLSIHQLLLHPYSKWYQMKRIWYLVYWLSPIFSYCVRSTNSFLYYKFKLFYLNVYLFLLIF